MRRGYRSALALLALLALAWSPRASLGQEQSRLFPETGWRVGGQLLTFWNASGGLPVFGLPLGAERRERTADGTYTLQHFERGRLELHPEKRPPYNVELGRLGADALAKQGRDWRRETGSQQLEGPCERFETGREVCGPFLEYWRGHGLELGDPGTSYREALALFGLPLTGPKLETNSSGDTVVTQWFERARFEHHPGNPAPYRVLLGRLGAELVGEPPPLERPEVHVTPGTEIFQGNTLAITARYSQGSTLTGRLGNIAVGFVKTGDGWSAMAAVPALQAPGPLTLTVEAPLADGRVAATTVEIMVRGGGYRTENIMLPPDVNERLERNEAALAEERRRVNAIWPVVTAERLWDGAFSMPTTGSVSSAFGTRRSYNGGPVDSFHEGTDISNRNGTPITAPARGRVVFAEEGLIARGGAVILDHGWGVHTGYWHMSDVLVPVGKLVERGEVIGLMGAEGMVTGPHLHWELHIGPTSADPMEWVSTDWP